MAIQCKFGMVFVHALNEFSFDVGTRIEDTIRDVSGAIIKLDDISADILTIIGNSREGAAAKKRRQLERKLNGMKTDMEKLNLKLLEAKDEVKSRDAKCFGKLEYLFLLPPYFRVVSMTALIYSNTT